MKNIVIHTRKKENLTEFLNCHGFDIESIAENTYRVVRDQELPVFLHINNGNIYFEVDLGNISDLGDQDFYMKLLDLNTEILPVSFGINSANPNDPRLVLVEGRKLGDLNDHELLSVFDALELAVDKAEVLLTRYLERKKSQLGE